MTITNLEEYLSNHPEVLTLDYIDGFIDGAWWVEDKIRGIETTLKIDIYNAHERAWLKLEYGLKKSEK